MYKVCITTYNRPESLSLLLEDIGDQDITIFDDGSDNPHPKAIKYEHHGKRFYYRLVSNMFEYLRNQDFEYFWMLPDDIRLKLDFFERSVDTWNLIDDDNKICLSVGHTHGRHKNPCWTRFQPKDHGYFWRTQWNDLCFMAPKKFLEVLDYKIDRPKEGYNYASSGVGRDISRRLHKLGYHMFHTNHSLCDFPANESVMHV